MAKTIFYNRKSLLKLALLAVVIITAFALISGCSGNPEAGSNSNDPGTQTASTEPTESTLTPEPSSTEFQCPTYDEEVLQWDGSTPNMRDYKTEWKLQRVLAWDNSSSDTPLTYLPYVPEIEKRPFNYIPSCEPKTPQGAVISAVKWVLNQYFVNEYEAKYYDKELVKYGLAGYSFLDYDGDTAKIGVIVMDTDPMIYDWNAFNTQLFNSVTIGLEWRNKDADNPNAGWYPDDQQFSKDFLTGVYEKYTNDYADKDHWPTRTRGIKYYNYTFWSPNAP